MNEELKHYGILGMKWGRHKSKVYQDAKTQYKKAKKVSFKSDLKEVGSYFKNDYTKRSEYNTKAGKEFITRQKDSNKAYANKIASKAKLKSITNEHKNKLGYNKAEFKTYVKGLKKSGVPNSLQDRKSSGGGTTMYNTIVRKKGKKYADAVLKKTSRKKANAVAISALATIGLGVTSSYLEKYK